MIYIYIYLCQKFGCDGHLDSGLNFDVCGKCNGSGRECNAVRGVFNGEGPERGKVFPALLGTCTSLRILFVQSELNKEENKNLI